MVPALNTVIHSPYSFAFVLWQFQLFAISISKFKGGEPIRDCCLYHFQWAGR